MHRQFNRGMLNWDGALGRTPNFNHGGIAPSIPAVTKSMIEKLSIDNLYSLRGHCRSPKLLGGLEYMKDRRNLRVTTVLSHDLLHNLIPCTHGVASGPCNVIYLCFVVRTLQITTAGDPSILFLWGDPARRGAWSQKAYRSAGLAVDKSLVLHIGYPCLADNLCDPLLSLKPTSLVVIAILPLDVLFGAC